MKTEDLKSKSQESLNKIKNFITLYKFELSLISFVLAGTIMEMFLYSYDGYAISGLIWLLPIYGAYKNQRKTMQTDLNA